MKVGEKERVEEEKKRTSGKAKAVTAKQPYIAPTQFSTRVSDLIIQKKGWSEGQLLMTKSKRTRGSQGG